MEGISGICLWRCHDVGVYFYPATCGPKHNCFTKYTLILSQTNITGHSKAPQSPFRQRKKLEPRKGGGGGTEEKYDLGRARPAQAMTLVCLSSVTFILLYAALTAAPLLLFFSTTAVPCRQVGLLYTGQRSLFTLRYWANL